MVQQRRWQQASTHARTLTYNRTTCERQMCLLKVLTPQYSTSQNRTEYNGDTSTYEAVRAENILQIKLPYPQDFKLIWMSCDSCMKKSYPSNNPVTADHIQGNRLYGDYALNFVKYSLSNNRATEFRRHETKIC